MAQENSNTPRAASHPWSLYIGRIAGIPLYLHFTFFLVPLLTISSSGGLESTVLVLALFACVVLHELGHALMARRFGIQTADIVLYPIGGVARLRSLGEGMQEFWIAIAGPMVNVVIAAGLYLILHLAHAWTPFAINWKLPWPSLVIAPALSLHPAQELMFLNIFLLLFNMIPAFPMDGGRVLRAILTNWLPRPQATAVAAGLGQTIALGFIIFGFFFAHDLTLAIIGFFIFRAAGQEKLMMQTATLITGHSARDAMISRFEVLQHGETLGRAADVLLQTNQHDFPVVSGSSVLGILSTKALLQGLAAHGRDQYVAQILNRDFPGIQAQASLNEVLELMQRTGGHPILVFEGEQLIGYINQDNLMEYLTLAKIGLVRSPGQ